MNKINKILKDWMSNYPEIENNKLRNEYSTIISAAENGRNSEADKYALSQFISRNYGICDRYYKEEMVEDAILLSGHLEYELFGTSIKDISETIKYLGEVILSHGITKLAMYTEGYYYRGKRFNKCLQGLQEYGWKLIGCETYTKPGCSVGDAFLIFEHEN